MKISRREEYKNIKENLIKDVRNLFKLKKIKKGTNDAAVTGIINHFRLEKKIRQLMTE